MVSSPNWFEQKLPEGDGRERQLGKEAGEGPPKTLRARPKTS